MRVRVPPSESSVNIYCRSGSYPTVSPGHSGQWALNPASHSLEWSIPLVSSEPAEDGTEAQTSGSMEFSVGGEEIDAFFPVKVSFVGLSSLLGINVSYQSLPPLSSSLLTRF